LSTRFLKASTYVEAFFMLYWFLVIADLRLQILLFRICKIKNMCYICTRNTSIATVIYLLRK